MSTLARLKSIITNECLLKNIPQTHINDSITHAEILFDEGEKIADCVRAAVAIAERKNKKFQFRSFA